MLSVLFIKFIYCTFYFKFFYWSITLLLIFLFVAILLLLRGSFYYHCTSFCLIAITRLLT